MLLAQRGMDVQVFEKQPVVGGRNAEVRLGDYRFDLGPTFLMMKFLLDELFEEANRKLSDYLDCRALDPMYNLQFAERSMHVYSDPARMRAEIERVFPGEGGALDRFLARESVRFRKFYPCLQKSYGSPLSLFSPTLLAALPHIAPGRSLHNVLSSYFRAEELRLAFTFQSKYLGMSPWDCPGLFTMIPYTEHAHGVYHVQGGLCQISHAMAQVAREYGAAIHTSQPVRRILTKGRRAVGVELGTGEKLECDDVVINADFGHAMSTLFEPDQLRRYKPETVRRKNWSCSTFMMYLGLDRAYPEAEHHTIVFDGRCVCLGGRNVLQLRMFPEGLAQLCESWQKAFADGAAASDSAVLALAVAWLTGLCGVFVLLCLAPWPLRGFVAVLYIVAAAQVFWFARPGRCVPLEHRPALPDSVVVLLRPVYQLTLEPHTSPAGNLARTTGMKLFILVTNVLVWPLIHLALAHLFLRFPDAYFGSDLWLTRKRRFEKDGQLYRGALAVQRWKGCCRMARPGWVECRKGE